jgi:hypothetical protein
MSDINNFIQGYTNKVKSRFDLLDIHIKEQAMWRAFLCNECLDNGKCLICKCSTPAMFYAPGKVDSKGRWGTMVSKEEWEKFKISNQQYKDFIDASNSENTGEVQSGVKLLGGESSIKASVQEDIPRGQQQEQDEVVKNNVGSNVSVSSPEPVLGANVI